jgi:uncharacterized protein YxjI
MALGRERRQERREDRREDRGGGGVTRFRMQEKLLSIGGDSWIEDEGGNRVFKVNGKALRLRRTLILEDAAGRELAKIQDRPVRVREVMEIEDTVNGRSAHVKKAMITPLRERYQIDIDGAGSWKAQGNIVDHEFEIEGDHGKVAEISKRWFRIRDSYGVEVEPGHDPALILAIAVCIDEMSRG